MRKWLIIFALLCVSTVKVCAQDAFNALEGFYAFKIDIPRVEPLAGKVKVYHDVDGKPCMLIRAKGHSFYVRDFRQDAEDGGKFHARGTLFRYVVPLTLEAGDYGTLILTITYQRAAYPIVLESISEFDFNEDDGHDANAVYQTE